MKLGSALFIDLTAYRNLKIAKRNVAAVLEEPQETGSFDDVPMRGAGIELAHVGFSYGDGPAVLEGFDLVIPEGKLTALVGDSGCGKSTVLNLIAQLYRPQDGSVSFGGVDVREIGRAHV